MDEKTLKIKDEICRQYKNPRQFSIATGIPYTTLKSALKVGIGGTAVETVVLICQTLNIELDEITGIKKRPPSDEPKGEREQRINEIVEEFSTLSDEDMLKLLDFVAFLKSKYNS